MAVRSRKLGSVREAKKSVKRSGGGNTVGIKDEGILVRYLTEPDQWTEFFEHWDDVNKKFEVCTDQCSFCDAGEKASKRYLANAVDLDSGNKVIALKMPQKCAQSVLRKYDRYKTLMDRDYTLTREGTGFDTEFDVNPEPPRKMDLRRFKLFDLISLLDGDEEDDDEDDEEEEAAPTKRVASRKGGTATVKRKPRPAPVEEDEDDEEEDDDPPFRKPVRKPVRSVAKPVRKAVKSPAPRVVKRKR